MDKYTETAKRNRFIEYALIVLKWKKFITAVTLTATAIAVVVSLLLPKWYSATTSLLPPKEQNNYNTFGGASSLLKGLSANMKLGSLGQSSGVYNYLAILKSRTAMEAVARQFNLPAVYEISDSSMEKTIKVLGANVSFDLQPDDYLTIEVLDKDPKRAADIANYFVELLNSISIQLGTQEAKSNKEFISGRLEEARLDLHNIEDSLKNFQDTHDWVSLPDNATTSISGIAELYANKAMKEVRLAILQRTSTIENPEIRQLKVEISEIRKKLENVPETGIGSFRLFREVAIRQKIVEYLTPIYEQARIEEQKNVPVILVLDKAIPPEKKSLPKRMYIVLSVLLSSIFISLIIVFIRERIIRLEREDIEFHSRFLMLRDALTFFTKRKHQ